MGTIFSDIVFDQSSHTYRIGDKPLTAVTRIVSQLKPPFDHEYWSQRKAAERGVSVQVILDEWDAKRKVSMARGIQVHEYIASVLRASRAANMKLSRHDEVILNTPRLPEMDAFDDLYGQMSDLKPNSIEWIVGDSDLGIAGTLDALLYNDKALLYYLFDWKTGSKFTTFNKFQPLLFPFDDLDDCDLNVYSLQLSFYRLIIERNTTLRIGNAHVVYLSQDGRYYLHEALNLCGRLERWLTKEK